jgi:hypothetical protein
MTTPNVTNKYAICRVCGIQWEVKSFATPPTDALACNFCGAGNDGDKDAVVVKDESPDKRR